SRKTVHSNAWMSTVTAEKQVTNRRTVARPAEHGSRDEELIERELTMKDLASGQAVGSFQIERRNDLSRHNRVFEAGSKRGDHSRRDVTQALAFSIPRRITKGEWRKLHVRRND